MCNDDKVLENNMVFFIIINFFKSYKRLCMSRVDKCGSRHTIRRKAYFRQIEKYVFENLTIINFHS